MVERIRIYNSNKEYYFFNAKQKNNFNFLNKPILVVKYVTKRKNTKEYASGRLVLPSKFFGQTIINKQYHLIKLHRTHILQDTKDLWGYAYLLFIKDNNTNKHLIRLNCDKKICLKRRKKYSKISKHTRLANCKKYTSGKIYVEPKLIGKSVIIIELKPTIEISYTQKKQTHLFDTDELEKIKDKGKGYVLFYEDKTAKILKTTYKKQRTIASYRETIALLNNNKNIVQISKKRKIKPTSVWNHICIAYKAGEIKQETLKEIILNNCHKDVKDEIIICVEMIRNKEYLELKKMNMPHKKFDKKSYITVSRKDLKTKLYEKTGKHIPINMIEAITLYLNSLYKK